MVKKINIELDEDQYKTLIDVLFIADYLPSKSLLFKDNKVSLLLDYIYSFGKGMQSSSWLLQQSSQLKIPITEDRGQSLLKDISSSVEKTVWNILAQKFVIKIRLFFK